LGLQSANSSGRWPGIAPPTSFERYVPCYTIARVPLYIDVLFFYGIAQRRRYAVLRELQRPRLLSMLSRAPSARAADAWIALSKIVLNLHYWEAQILRNRACVPICSPYRAVSPERGADPTLESRLESRRRSPTTTNWAIAVWSSSATSRETRGSPIAATRLSPLATRPLLQRALSEGREGSPTREKRKQKTKNKEMRNPRARRPLHRCSSRRPIPRPQMISSASASLISQKFEHELDSCWPRSTQHSRGFCAVGLFPSPRPPFFGGFRQRAQVW